ncbi:MAG: hypothetical protein AB2401_12730 [Bacillus sp. (in: firmicutes)]
MLIWLLAKCINYEGGLIMEIQIKYTKTIVGFYNVRLARGNDDHYVNLSPAQFAKLVPGVSNKARYGCAEISVEQGRELMIA